MNGGRHMRTNSGAGDPWGVDNLTRPEGMRCHTRNFAWTSLPKGPGSMVGFDFARTFNPSTTLGTAQGMVNMGGFLASLLLMQAMGVILEATGGLSFDSFRIAWTLQYVVWSVAVVGILVTRRKARRLLRLQDDRSLLEGIEK